MLEKGINSYVDIDETIDYLNSAYREFDDLACRFKVLKDTEKTIYLINACQQINKLVLQGKPLRYDQPLAFPRAYCYLTQIIPEAVKYAQIENALGLLKEEYARRSMEQVNLMGSLGIMQNIKYDKKTQGEVGIQIAGVTAKKRLASASAEELLRPWLGGN